MSNPTKDSFKKACERMLVSSDGKMLKDTMNENTFKTLHLQIQNELDKVALTQTMKLLEN